MTCTSVFDKDQEQMSEELLYLERKEALVFLLAFT